MRPAARHRRGSGQARGADEALEPTAPAARRTSTRAVGGLPEHRPRTRRLPRRTNRSAAARRDVRAVGGGGRPAVRRRRCSQLLAERNRPEAMAGAINVVSAVVERMSDESVAGFVADSVIDERGATERLAQAFQALVPELDRQRQLLALARARGLRPPKVREQDGDFAELWNGVETMLTSYSDASYVSEEYARELSRARTRAGRRRARQRRPARTDRGLGGDGERCGAAHPRSAAAARSPAASRRDPPRWRDVADTVAAHADDLVRVGHFDQAWPLVDAVIARAQRSRPGGRHAAAALERFGRGAIMKHVRRRTCAAPTSVDYERFKGALPRDRPARSSRRSPRCCPPNRTPRAPARLRDVLVGFGAARPRSRCSG